MKEPLFFIVSFLLFLFPLSCMATPSLEEIQTSFQQGEYQKTLQLASQNTDVFLEKQVILTPDLLSRRMWISRAWLKLYDIRSGCKYASMTIKSGATAVDNFDSWRPVMNYLIGRCSVHDTEFEDAEYLLGIAVKEMNPLDNDYLDALESYAITLVATGKNDAAKAVLKKILPLRGKNNPSDHDIALGLDGYRSQVGTNCYRHYKYQCAEQFLKPVIEHYHANQHKNKDGIQVGYQLNVPTPLQMEAFDGLIATYEETGRKEPASCLRKEANEYRKLIQMYKPAY